MRTGSDAEEAWREDAEQILAAASDNMIRVLVVARVRFYREGIAAALAADPRFDACGSASDLQDAADRIEVLEPDVVLLDLAGADGPHAVRRLVERAPATRVVALGVTEAEDDVVPLAEAGVAGYVTRDGSVDDLLAAIESVAAGETLCSPKIAASLLRRVTKLAREQRTRAPDVARSLTTREREILSLIDEGLSNKEIATKLRIELATVKNHVHNILDKLHVHRRGEAAAAVRAQQ